MWLMTKYGFYSIVQKRRGIYHIRAREAGDLGILTAPGGPLAGERILEGQSDYPYRVIVGAVEVRRLMEFLAQSLDYSNFKAEIDRQPHQQRKPYHRVWALLADALGSFGRLPITHQMPAEDSPWTTTQTALL